MNILFLLNNLNNQTNTWVNFDFIFSLLIIFFSIFFISLIFESQASSIKVKLLNYIISFLLINLLVVSDISLWISTQLNVDWVYYNGLTVFFSTVSLIFVFFASIIFLSFADEFYLYENKKIEFPLLVFLVVLSGIFLLMSSDLIEILICLECIAFSSYVLVGFERKNKLSALSGIKYLIISTIPSSFFVLGMILLYSSFGTFVNKNLEILINNLFNESKFSLNNSVSLIYFNSPQKFILNSDDFFISFNIFFDFFNNFIHLNEISLVHEYLFLSIYIGIFFMIINFLFKVTSAPFHVWAPSIYNSAPTSTVLFLAVFSKIVLFCFFMNIFSTVFYSLKYFWGIILIISCLLSIFLGMFGAFGEKYIKKFVVFSSMSHVGFMLIGFPFFILEGNKFIINYLIIYSISSVIIWLIFMFSRKHVKFLTNLRLILMGDFLLNFIFSINMFSMSGIPPLAGFFVKFDILFYILHSSNFYLSFFIFIATVANFFYYLRIIKIIYFENMQWNENRLVFSNEKLFIISSIIHIILFFVLYIDETLYYILENILISLL